MTLTEERIDQIVGDATTINLAEIPPDTVPIARMVMSAIARITTKEEREDIARTIIFLRDMQLRAEHLAHILNHVDEQVVRTAVAAALACGAGAETVH